VFYLRLGFVPVSLILCGSNSNNFPIPPTFVSESPSQILWIKISMIVRNGLMQT